MFPQVLEIGLRVSEMNRPKISVFGMNKCIYNWVDASFYRNTKMLDLVLGSSLILGLLK